MTLPIPCGRWALKKCSLVEETFKVSQNSLDARGEAAIDFQTGIPNPGQKEPKAAWSCWRLEEKALFRQPSQHARLAQLLDSVPPIGITSPCVHNPCGITEMKLKRKKPWLQVREACHQPQLYLSCREGRKIPPSGTIPSSVTQEKGRNTWHQMFSL